MRFKVFLMLGLVSLFLHSTLVFGRVVFIRKQLFCTPKKFILPQASYGTFYLTSDKNGKFFKITQDSVGGKDSIEGHLNTKDQAVTIYLFDDRHSIDVEKLNMRHFINGLAMVCQEDIQSLRVSLKSLLKQEDDTYIFPLNLSTPEAKKALSQENPTCRLSEGKRVGSWFASHTYECFFPRKSL